MKKYVLFLFAIVLGLSACNEKAEGFKVDVSLANGNGKTLYLQKLVDNAPVVIDSADIKNDLATLTAPTGDPQTLYALKVKGMRGSMPFFADNKDVTIVGDMNNPQAVAIMASESQTAWDDFNEQMDKFDEQINGIYAEMQQAFADSNNELVDSLNQLSFSIMEQKDNYRDDYIKTHSNSFVAHYILDEVKQDYPLAQLKELAAGFTTESVYSKDINDYIAKQERLEVGQPFIDFTLQTNEDTELVLSQIIPQNKLTLVDFWASWCGPCRHENPVVKAAYEQFHELGFEVIGVSVDDDEAAWLEAVAADQLSWTQVRDIDDKVSEAYSIYYIPANFLFDQNGTMVAKGLRGDQLTAKLAEILK